MEEAFYKKHTSDFFYGKRAKMLRTIENKEGQKLRKGQIVLLEGKRKIMTSYLTCSGGFGVRSLRKNKKGVFVFIRGVSWESLDLIKV